MIFIKKCCLESFIHFKAKDQLIIILDFKKICGQRSTGTGNKILNVYEENSVKIIHIRL